LFVKILLELVHFGFESLSEVFECNYHHSDVVERFFSHRAFQNSLNSDSTVLMDSLSPISELFLGGFPSGLDHLNVCKLVVDAVAAQYNVVVIVLDFEAFDVWRGNDNFWIALVLGPFGLNVAKSSTD